MLSQENNVPLNGHAETLELNTSGDQSQDQVEVEMQGTVVGGITGLEIIGVPLQPEQGDLRGQLVEFGPQEDTLSSLESSRSGAALTQDLKVKQDVALESRKRSSEEDCGGTGVAKVPHLS